MAAPSNTPTTPAAPAAPAPQTAAPVTNNSTNTKGSEHHFLWGVVLIAAGLLVGYFWLWGNAVQIQTSEAWIVGKAIQVTLSPHLDIFLQVTQFWSGNLTYTEMIAYTWGWLSQIILLAFSIGIEFHIGGRGRARAWKWCSILFIVLNSLADLNYGNAFGGSWQPWLFAAACFMASFFFGLAGIGLIVEGVKRIFGMTPATTR